MPSFIIINSDDSNNASLDIPSEVTIFLYLVNFEGISTPSSLIINSEGSINASIVKCKSSNTIYFKITNLLMDFKSSRPICYNPIQHLINEVQISSNWEIFTETCKVIYNIAIEGQEFWKSENLLENERSLDIFFKMSMWEIQPFKKIWDNIIWIPYLGTYIFKYQIFCYGQICNIPQN